MNQHCKMFCFLALASLGAVLPLQAATQTWLGGGGANPQAFGDPLNWSPGGTLAASDVLVITTPVSGQFPIISTGANGQYPTAGNAVASLTIGNGAADGKLEQDSGTFLVTGDIRVGSTTSTGSTLAITGGVFNQQGGDQFIGMDGTTGTLALSGTAVDTFVNSGANIWVGIAGAGSKGTISISDTASLTTNSNLWIGATQTGYLNMQGGTLTCNSWFNVGCNGYGSTGNSGYGSVTIDGTSKIVMTGGGNMAIGVNDNGTSGAYANIVLQGSSSLTCNNGSTIYVGYSGTGSAPTTLALHGSSTVTLNSTSGLIVGNGTAGTMTMDGSSVFNQTSGGTIIGNGNGSNGTLTITGSAQFLENQPRATGRLVIGTPCDAANPSVATLTLGTLGGSDNPTFTIADVSAGVIGDANSHVTVNINTGTFNGNSLNSGGYVGMGYGAAVVTWNQNGGLTNFPAGSSPFIGCGNGDNVTLNFNGGVFAIPYIKTDTPNYTATVNINFNGGTLQANGNDPSSTFPFINVRSNGTFNGTVKSGGAVWDTNGFTNTMQYPMVHDDTLGSTLDGGLKKLGAGLLTLTADNIYTGPTAIQAGSLVLTGTAATSAVTMSTNTTLTLANAAPFTGAVPTEITVPTGATLISALDGNTVSAYANVTFGNKSYLTMTGSYLSTLAIQKLSSTVNGAIVVVDVPALASGGTLLTYQSKDVAKVPKFIPKVDSVGMNDFSMVDDNAGNITANLTDQTYGRSWQGLQKDDYTLTQSWYNSVWWDNYNYNSPSPNGSDAKAWFNDLARTDTTNHNVILDTPQNVTLSSMLFNGSYTISKKTGANTPAIILQSTIAGNTQIQAVAGDSIVYPDIKMAAGDPIFTVFSDASLTLNGVLSNLVGDQPANVTIAGPGTLTLNGANTYTGSTILQGGTLRVGNAGAVGAASSTFTLAGGTLTDAGANVTLNHGFTIGGSATLAPVNNLTIAGPIAYASGSLTNIGPGTVTFKTPTVTTNNFGSTLSTQGGTLAFDGVTGTVYNFGVLNVGTALSSNSTMTVNNVKVVGTALATIGGYWSGPATPGTRPIGALTLSGSATAEFNAELRISDEGGKGTLTLNDSATVIAHNLVRVGYNWGDDAATEMSDGQVIMNGGHFVQDTASRIGIATSGGVGVWNQNAGLAETTNTVMIGEGYNAASPGAGTLNLNGGTFQAPGLYTGSTVSGHAAATIATVNFNGATLKATADNADFIANTTGATLTLNVLKNGTSGLGAVIDSNGKTVKLTKPLVTGVVGDSDGGLTKLGLGTLLTSVPNTYTGPTVVKDGTVQLKTTPLVLHQEASTPVNAVGGRSDGPYALGRDFTVNAAQIVVTQLGVFDDSGNGLNQAHLVHLTNMTDSSDYSVAFTAGQSGTYQNGYRFISLNSPLTITPGNYKVWVDILGGGASGDNFSDDSGHPRITSFDTGTAGDISLGNAVYDLVPGTLPTNHWGTSYEVATSFIYYNPSSVITANLLPITTPVLMGGAAGSTPTLDLQGANQQIASLADLAGSTVFGIVKNSTAATRVVLKLSATSGTTTYSGSIDGNLSLVKEGGSTQFLTGPLSYIGNTTVNGGKLSVTDLNTPGSAVAVATGSTLVANSIVADSLSIGGGPYVASAAINTVPEPSTLMLLALAGLAIGGAYFRPK